MSITSDIIYENTVEVQQFICQVLECYDDKQRDKYKNRLRLRQLEANLSIKDSDIGELQNKVRQLEAKLIIKDGEIKQLKDDLAESKRNSYVFALKELCNCIDLYCIGKALNMSQRKLRKEGIEKYYDFSEYLNETYLNKQERHKYLNFSLMKNVH